jgi:hypothetical protein
MTGGGDGRSDPAGAAVEPVEAPDPVEAGASSAQTGVPRNRTAPVTSVRKTRFMKEQPLPEETSHIIMVTNLYFF